MIRPDQCFNNSIILHQGASSGALGLIKLIYCACQKILEKWNQPMHNWALIISQLHIYFEDRLNLGLR
jgi:transposase-like protein